MKAKRDLNYVASVEKAISEKYGKDTVQDFRSKWDEEKERHYLEQLKEQNKRNQISRGKKSKKQVGDVFISKPLRSKKNERVCPVCKTYSFSTEDDLYMNRFQCCCKCYYDFIDHSEERWKTGWRPNEKQLEIALQRRRK